MENLFSYGTLQQKDVQIESYGRQLTGYNDQLSGFVISTIKILDERVIKLSGTDSHLALVLSGNHEDKVKGMVYEINRSELDTTDDYEVDDYKRIEATLDSGNNAWVYILK